MRTQHSTPLAPAPASGTAVIGWSPRTQAWVTDPGAPGDHVPPPPLDGTLELSSRSLGSDFGRLVHREPGAVLRASSPEDVAAIVRFARDCGMDVAMNGQGGRDDHRESHSLHGQALVGRGIAVDATSLGTIHEIGNGFADVDAGVRWSSLVQAAAATGQTVPVVNDFPYLSIGGTLSIGGMGATSHRYGSQADNVERLHVVTGRGDLVACSPTEHRDLFDAVLAGAGQYGLIVRAVVRLVPAPTSVRMVRVAYADRDAYLRDAITVTQTAGLVDDVNGAVVPVDGGWGHVLILATYSGPSTPAGAGAHRSVLGSLDPTATLQEEQEMPYLQWLFRLDPMWDHLQQHGYWAQAKPRVTLFVPASQAAALAETVLAELTPDDLGAGGVRLSPVNPAAIRRPMFVLPDGAPAAFELSVGRFPAPDHPDIPGLLAQNRRFYDRAVELGAKRYLYGAIPDMSAADWQRHYGDRWPAIAELKARFDPDQVLTPGQGIFG